MTVKLYLDVHVHDSILHGLRQRGVDVLSSRHDGMRTLPDPELLEHAKALGRVLFTMDTDYLRIVADWQREGRSFSGVVFAHQDKVLIGKTIDDLELLAKVYDPPDMFDRLEYLPL